VYGLIVSWNVRQVLIYMTYRELEFMLAAPRGITTTGDTTGVDGGALAQSELCVSIMPAAPIIGRC
jgi:hypothetical protein